MPSARLSCALGPTSRWSVSVRIPTMRNRAQWQSEGSRLLVPGRDVERQHGLVGVSRRRHAEQDPLTAEIQAHGGNTRKRQVGGGRS